MPITLCAAGCRFSISVPRLGRKPENLLDLELPGETSTLTAWTVELARDPMPSAASEPAGWSGSRGARVFCGDGFAVRFGDRVIDARYDPRRGGASSAAAQLAVFGALRREGRADLHASAVVPPGSSEAILFAGPSGHGKSTLAVLALSKGWGFLSDDLIAVFSDGDGALTLAPLRRTLRVAESAIPLLPASGLPERWTRETPRKLIVDPEACGLGPRHSRARPRLLIFLEKGTARSVRSVSSAQAFERLMLQSPQLIHDPDSRSAIIALKRLAEEVPARSAALPLDSLHDVATLEDLLS